MEWNRRDFLRLLGITALALGTTPEKLLAKPVTGPILKGVSPKFDDTLHVTEGLHWQIMLREGQKLTSQLSFGVNNDYLQFFPLTPERGILWVNHEYPVPVLMDTLERSRSDIEKEMAACGGSLVEIIKKDTGWTFVENSTYNKRLDAFTVIPFAWDTPIRGSLVAQGTFANCAGGKTPWNTVLTCEENYNLFYGERDEKTDEVSESLLSWEKFHNNPPEHYGWVVEVNPKTAEAKKLVALGRFAHECATVRLGKGDIPVVYSGDDANDEHLYKFIADKVGSLERGTLYVADIKKGQWIPLQWDKNPILKSKFKDQTDVLIHCRKAAKLVGGTPLDRPEDIEIDPHNGNVLITCTNNKAANRPHGKILQIKEKANDPLSLHFTAEDYLVGGEKGGFACPDNLAFDKAGNLWFTTDIAGSDMAMKEYANFGNNGLFCVLRRGELAGMPIQIASAPRDAEFTGPLFSPDGETLFLSVQHPGETSMQLDSLTSHWPDGGSSRPLSCVITIQGPLLKKITEI